MAAVCVITRIRNDEFFLKKFISYYGRELGEENLYVYLDGHDQKISFDCGRTNIISCDRIDGNVVQTDRGRLNFLSDRAAELFKHYDIVIGVDVDEFLVVDPKIGKGLKEYLVGMDRRSSVSGLGVDVGQHMDLEAEIDGDAPFLGQRSFAVVSTRYTKPSVITKPLRWGAGFHRIKGHNYHIDPNLYLFHFGCVDMNMILARFSDKDRMSMGWERHIKKRTRTIDYVTKLKAREGDRFLPIARLLQTILRPIYALNKPSMLGWKLVVRIPDRFREVL